MISHRPMGLEMVWGELEGPFESCPRLLSGTNAIQHSSERKPDAIIFRTQLCGLAQLIARRYNPRLHRLFTGRNIIDTTTLPVDRRVSWSIPDGQVRTFQLRFQ